MSSNSVSGHSNRSSTTTIFPLQSNSSLGADNEVDLTQLSGSCDELEELIMIETIPKSVI